jgi:imidazolonepropionase-like amidohydrolase
MREDEMLRPDKFVVVLAAAITGAASAPAWSQTLPKYLVPQDQVIAIRAGHMFDSQSGSLLDNQVILIKGDRITDVGPGLPIPAGARVIDLSTATVLPGMIDAHVHLNAGGETPAQRALIAMTNAQSDLAAGFTTELDMDSRGGFNTVDLRDMINDGIVLGPRLQVVGQAINQRATNYYPDSHPDPIYGRYTEGFTETKNINSPWLARGAVREAKLHGVDYIKVYTTQDFDGQVHMWNRDATLVSSPSLTFEEIQAVVDEAHRLGLKVACHAYSGEGMYDCLNAGIDAPNHLLGTGETFINNLLGGEQPDLQ